MDRDTFKSKLSKVQPGPSNLVILFVIPFIVLILIRTINAVVTPLDIIIITITVVLTIFFFEYNYQKYRKMVRLFDSGNFTQIIDILTNRLHSKNYINYAQKQYIKDIVNYLHPGYFDDQQIEMIKDEIFNFVVPFRRYNYHTIINYAAIGNLILLIYSVYLIINNEMTLFTYALIFLSINGLLIISHHVISISRKKGIMLFEETINDPQKGLTYYKQKRINGMLSKNHEFKEEKEDIVKNYDYIIELISSYMKHLKESK